MSEVTLLCPHCGQTFTVNLNDQKQRRPGLLGIPRFIGHYGFGLDVMDRTPTFDGERTVYQPLPNHVMGIAAGAMTSQTWKEVTFESPAREPNIDSDVAVPALQAAVTGCAIGFITSGLTWAVLSQKWEHIFILGCAAGLISFTYTWWQLLDDQRSLLRTVERYVGRDLDGDGVIGTQKPAAVRLEMYQDNGAYSDVAKIAMFASLPVDEARFTTLIKGALSGQPLTQSRWTGGSGPFSRSEFDNVMAALEEANVVRWIDSNNHAQGRELTRPGKSALHAWLVNRS